MFYKKCYLELNMYFYVCIYVQQVELINYIKKICYFRLIVLFDALRGRIDMSWLAEGPSAKLLFLWAGIDTSRRNFDERDSANILLLLFARVVWSTEVLLLVLLAVSRLASIA